MQTINLLVNNKGNIVVIDSSEDFEVGTYFEECDFIRDWKNLNEKWLYLFDEDGYYIQESELSKEKSTIFTLEFWVEEIPDIECGGYDFYYHITDIKKIKINY